MKETDYMPKPYEEALQPIQEAIPEHYRATPMGRALRWWHVLCEAKRLRFEVALTSILETAAIRRSIITDQAKDAN